MGAREPDAAARNPDFLAERLLGDPSEFDVQHPVVDALRLDYAEAMRSAEVVGNVRMMTVRARFIDEALERAVADGASQVVILGAGFDSHAYRFEALLTRVKVFEVDRPVTQALKIQRVNEALGGPPANLTYAAIDFEHEDLPSGLARCGHDRSQRTFFAMEGLLMYLPEDAVRATLGFVADHPPGSSVVFDFFYRPMIERIAQIDMANIPAVAKPFVERFRHLVRDEPWRSGFPMDGEREYLGELGLELREVLAVGGEESVKRYLTRTDGTQVGAQALAETAARFAAQLKAAAPPAAQGQPDLAAQMRERQRMMAYQLADAVVAWVPSAHKAPMSAGSRAWHSTPSAPAKHRNPP